MHPPEKTAPARRRYSVEAKLGEMRVKKSVLEEDEFEAAAVGVSAFKAKYAEEPDVLKVKKRVGGKWEVVIDITPDDKD